MVILPQKENNNTEKLLEFLTDHNWVISFDNKSQYKGQCCINIETKSATIYSFGEKFPWKDYKLHELLHILFREIGFDINQEKEESLIKFLTTELLE